MKTLYDILGVHPDDDSERLKAAFRKAVKACHPDLNLGDPDAPDRFMQIRNPAGLTQRFHRLGRATAIFFPMVTSFDSRNMYLTLMATFLWPFAISIWRFGWIRTLKAATSIAATPYIVCTSSTALSP